ncbi:MAG: methyltransferase domain-containing protein [Bacteroidales bacterium]
MFAEGIKMSVEQYDEQIIRAIDENLREITVHKIIIYPMGNIGFRIKEILSSRYETNVDWLIDDKLCETDIRCVSSSILETLDLLQYVVLVANRQADDSGMLDQRPLERLIECNMDTRRIILVFEDIVRGYAALKIVLKEVEFHTVLDIGCGKGLQARMFADAGKQVTANTLAGFNEYAGPLVSENCSLILGDFMAVDFPGQYDVVWSSHFLEHVDNVNAVLQKMKSLVKEGGTLCITVPSDDTMITLTHQQTFTIGRLLRYLVFAGIDCRQAIAYQRGYDISIIIKALHKFEVDKCLLTINNMRPGVFDFLPESIVKRTLLDGNIIYDSNIGELNRIGKAIVDSEGISLDHITRFINCTIPVTTCNLRCGYCFVTQSGQYAKSLEPFPYTPGHIAQSLSFDRLGGSCLVNICGLGETMLPPEIIELTRLLLEQGHYVAIVTNGTLKKRFEELCSLPQELLGRLFIKFSFHYIELKRLHLLDVFFENVNLIRSLGASFSLEIVASDNYLPYLDEVKQICLEKVGAYCHVLESRNATYADLPRLTKDTIKTHQEVWKSFDSALFEYQQMMWGVKQRGFCYAGEYSVDLDLWSGDIRQCNQGKLLQNIYENVDEPIHFCAIGTNCPSGHCFICYVWQTLCGDIPELPRVFSYDDMRNRVCRDGSKWLRPKVINFFRQCASENHKPYNADKKAYINVLMALEYENGQDECDLKTISTILEIHLKERNIRSVAIWGIDRHEQWLFSLLQRTSIKVRYVVDSNYFDNSKPTLKEKLKRQIKFILKSILHKKEQPLILNRYDKLPQVDAIIISDYPHFGEIKRQLVDRPYKNLLSLTELAD